MLTDVLLAREGVVDALQAYVNAEIRKDRLREQERCALENGNGTIPAALADEIASAGSETAGCYHWLEEEIRTQINRDVDQRLRTIIGASRAKQARHTQRRQHSRHVG